MPKVPTVRPKIGFLWHMAEMYFHHRNILNLLDPDEFEIVVYEDEWNLHPASDIEMVPLLKQLGYHYTFAQDLLDQHIVYQTLVSSHMVTIKELYQNGVMYKKGFLPRLLSQINVRLMYTMGKDYWNYTNWSNMYDVHLCFGPWQVKQLAFCDGLKVQVGYPRYDDYFNQSIDKTYWLQQLHCDLNKPTLLWLPTQKDHSILHFAQPLAELLQDYNIIVKPHPLLFYREPEVADYLEKFAWTALVKDSLDTLVGFSIADFVLADQGGSAFGAIYTDQNLLLLNNPDYQGGVDFLPQNTEGHLREYIPNLNPDQAHRIPEILHDEQLWQNQRQQRERLRQQYFAPYYGHSAQRVCEVLRNLGNSIVDQGFI